MIEKASPEALTPIGPMSAGVREDGACRFRKRFAETRGNTTGRSTKIRANESESARAKP